MKLIVALIYSINSKVQITLNAKTIKTHCAEEHLDRTIPFSK